MAYIDKVLEDWMEVENTYPDWNKYSFVKFMDSNILYRYDRNVNYEIWDSNKRVWVSRSRSMNPLLGRHHYINSIKELFLEML